MEVNDTNCGRTLNLLRRFFIYFLKANYLCTAKIQMSQLLNNFLKIVYQLFLRIESKEMPRTSVKSSTHRDRYIYIYMCKDHNLEHLFFNTTVSWPFTVTLLTSWVFQHPWLIPLSFLLPPIPPPSQPSSHSPAAPKRFGGVIVYRWATGGRGQRSAARLLLAAWLVCRPLSA